jgi:hypothetical protein
MSLEVPFAANPASTLPLSIVKCEFSLTRKGCQPSIEMCNSSAFRSWVFATARTFLAQELEDSDVRIPNVISAPHDVRREPSIRYSRRLRLNGFPGRGQVLIGNRTKERAKVGIVVAIVTTLGLGTLIPVKGQLEKPDSKQKMALAELRQRSWVQPPGAYVEEQSFVHPGSTDYLPAPIPSVPKTDAEVLKELKQYMRQEQAAKNADPSANSGGSTEVKVAKEVYDNPQMQMLVPAPTLRAMVAAQTIEPTKTAPDHLLNDTVPGNPSLPRWNNISYGAVSPGAVAEVFLLLDNGQLEIIWNQNLAGEDWRAGVSVMAHEIVHQAGGLAQADADRLSKPRGENPSVRDEELNPKALQQRLQQLKDKALQNGRLIQSENGPMINIDKVMVRAEAPDDSDGSGVVGVYQEAFATAIQTQIYLRQLAVHPELAQVQTALTQVNNTAAIPRLQSSPGDASTALPDPTKTDLLGINANPNGSQAFSGSPTITAVSSGRRSWVTRHLPLLKSLRTPM